MRGKFYELIGMSIKSKVAEVLVKIYRTVTTTRPSGTKETTGIIYENPFFDDETAVSDYLDWTTSEDWWRQTVVSYLTGTSQRGSTTRIGRRSRREWAESVDRRLQGQGYRCAGQLSTCPGEVSY